jgi:hypothetical protein
MHPSTHLFLSLSPSFILASFTFLLNPCDRKGIISQREDLTVRISAQAS